MNKKSFQKSYDIKTFLNKKKSGSRFLFLTFTNIKPGALPGIVALIIFATITYNVFGAANIFSDIIMHGVESVVSLWEVNDDRKCFDTEKYLVLGVSPMLKPKKSKVVSENQKKQEIKFKEPEIRAETVYTNGVEIKNETDFQVEPVSLLAQKIHELPQNPKVLIVHTHGSESYTSDETHSYTHNGNYRTQNTDFNVIRVGEQLKESLESKGITVIHDKTINDYPSYNDSYNKTGEIIKNYTEKDKDIAFVFDIHRDAVGTGDSVVKFTTQTEGKTAAQIMIVCGSDANLENPLWRENFKLAVHIQDYFTRKYPGFLRPVNLRKERFNMHLTTGSLLFEIGTNGNSLKEALAAAEIFGKGLGDFINIVKNS